MNIRPTFVVSGPVSRPRLSEALRYHRLGRLTPPWWRPLATLAVALLALGVLLAAGGLALVIGALAVPALGTALDASVSTPDMNRPFDVVCMLGMLALLIPAARFAVRVTGRPGTLDSVAGRVRWGLLGWAAALAVPVLAAFTVISCILAPTPLVVGPNTAAFVLIALVVVPFQAAGEEYFFRGLLPQVLGSWLRAPAWGVIASVPLFVIGHDYDALGLASVGIFAVIAAWLVWRTGGLEAAIGLHAVNNATGFLYQAFGDYDANVIPPTDVPTFLMVSAIPVLFAVVFEAWWRRFGASRFASTHPVDAQAAPLEPSAQAS